MVLAFEPLEALRVGLKFASEEGIVIMNEKSIATGRVFSANLLDLDDCTYPTTEKILGYFKRAKINAVIHFDAWDVAIQKAGTPLSLNIVMLGAAVGTNMIPVRPGILESAIEATVPEGSAMANLEAFQAGVETVKKLMASH